METTQLINIRTMEAVLHYRRLLEEYGFNAMHVALCHFKRKKNLVVCHDLLLVLNEKAEELDLRINVNKINFDTSNVSSRISRLLKVIKKGKDSDFLLMLEDTLPKSFLKKYDKLLKKNNISKTKISENTYWD